MSGKKNNATLLIPGPLGWEVWEANGAGEAVLKTRTEVVRALEVEGLPARDLHMAFPVREVSALPMKSPASDPALFADMADMHIERLGMRPPEMGVLSDHFEVAVREGDALLLPVVLAPPPEGTLPARSPRSFDVSARCYPMPVGGVAVWRELGRWVFGIGVEGRPLYFQALAAPILGEAAGREIGMALTQLQIQGVLDSRPQQVFVWLEEDEIGPGDEQLAELGRTLGCGAGTAPKPAPSYPAKPSALLPADTRAERIAKRKRQQAAAVVSALVVAYLGVVGWLSWKLIDKSQEARQKENEAAQLAGSAAGVLEHTTKWAELEPITSTEHWPVEQLYRCVEAIPQGGVRFKQAQFTNQLAFREDGPEIIRSISLQGEGQGIEQVNNFNLNLNRSSQLAAYTWKTPPARQTPTGAWSFNYDASFQEGAAN